MNAFQSRSGGCCCGFLTLNNFGEGSEVLVQPLRSSFDDEQKVARKRTYLTAVVAVVMSASMAQVSIWAAAGLPDRRRE